MDLVVRGEPAFASTGGAPFDPTRPVLVFVAGSGMHRAVWSVPARYFAHHGYAVLAVDLPGHGRSGGEALRSVPDMADWLVDVLDVAGVQKASFVGHSMGSLIVLDLAARYPDRVGSIALLGAAAEMPVHPELLAAAEVNDIKADRLIASWSHGDVGHIGGQKSSGVWAMGGVLRVLAEAGPGVLFRDLSACATYSGRQSAGRVAGPALVICGARDRMTRVAAGKQLAELIPGARCETIPEAGHMMHTELPDETLRILRTFF